MKLFCSSNTLCVCMCVCVCEEPVCFVLEQAAVGRFYTPPSSLLRGGHEGGVEGKHILLTQVTDYFNITSGFPHKLFCRKHHTPNKSSSLEHR